MSLGFLFVGFNLPVYHSKLAAGVAEAQARAVADAKLYDAERDSTYREVKDLIIALARRGKTVILSSHLLADVEDVCDRVVIYYGGRIQAMGTLKELLARPDAVRIEE